MPSSARKKEHPLSMRLPQTDIAIIDRAADLRGKSRTEFVRDAAVRAAEEVVMENTLLRLNSPGYKQFMKLIAAPPRAVPEMVRLFKQQPPWETAKSGHK